MSNHITKTDPRRRAGGLALIPLALLLLVACGNSSTATVPAPTAVSTTAAAPSAAPSAVQAAAPSPAASPAAPLAVATGAATAATPAATGATPAAAQSTPATPAASAVRYAIVPNSSKATYQVQETFFGRGLATATGSTGAVSGELTIDKQNPSKSTIGTITVDISKLTSDDSQRDNRIRGEWLESRKYPTATFVAKRLEGLPTTPYTDGQELTFKIVGDLTIRNVTKEVTFDAKGTIAGDTFNGSAATKFNMTDFGFNPPEVAGFLKAENGVALTLTIQAQRAQ